MNGVPNSVRLADRVLWACVAVTAFGGLTTAYAIWHMHNATPGFLDAATAVGGRYEAENLLPNLSDDLRYNLLVCLGATVLLALLAVAVRRPSGLARALVWCAAFVVPVAFGCGLAASPEKFTQSDSFSAPLRHAQANLLPVWYPYVQSLVMFGILVCLLAASALLLRTSAGDFYRRQRGGPPEVWTLRRQ